MGKDRIHSLLLFVLISLFSASALFSVEQQSDEYYKKIRENLDLYQSVLREITTRYVDDIDPQEFIRSGIEGMLETLDPYTIFIPREDTEDLRIMTSGKYGGVGIVIGLTGEAKRLTVISPIEDTPADRLGIRAGDIITYIDSISTEGFDTRKAASLMRGDPGTSVKITIQRQGVSDSLDYVIERARINVKDVTTATMLEDEVGYIRLARFSKKAGAEMEDAVKDLKFKGMKGLILDLRGNPGGLLEAAVDVAEKLVPENETIVSTRGARPEMNRNIQSRPGQRISDCPVVALVDEGSASASEIVAGALQDLDSGVIIGIQTFGKGLVQSIVPLSNGNELKMTTAKYYTPSGRLIQKVDYFARENPVILQNQTDSTEGGKTLKFYTKGGREVRSAGGITPDIEIERNKLTDLTETLFRKQMFFSFATTYLTESTSEVALDDPEIMNKFERFLKDTDFSYNTAGQTEIEALKELAAEKNLGEKFTVQLQSLTEILEERKKDEFIAQSDKIERYLRMEFAYRQSGAAGRLLEAASGDPQLMKAVHILQDKVYYNNVLSGSVSAGE